jgi:poly(3-hydroxybutyrate) depolymerase
MRVTEKVVWERPFCRLVHFERDLPAAERVRDPKILLVAPMSGHFATLLRGTVEALLPGHEVYITDWQDARDVPVTAGRFDLDDYIDYVREMLRYFAGDVHVFAVCQPAVPVLAAVSLMEQDHDPAVPRSMILAGGPIDTRVSPTAVNDVAVERGTDWFRNHVISSVPWPNVGAGREVYPGFLQLSGFMSMNISRHTSAHKELFLSLVRGDGDSAEKHREFYDEYLAVMDLTAEFYLQTVDTVFVRQSLPKGRMLHRGRRVDPSQIRRTALMTIEGGKDDITGAGQCHAAHDLCQRIPAARRLAHDATEVGHYGIFNGSRFRAEIAPRIAAFVRAFDPRSEFIPLITERARGATPPPRPAFQAYEPSFAAFTFAPANDTEPDPNVDRLRREGLGQRAALFADAAEAHAAPWRLWALATGFMLGGFFKMREPGTEPAAHDRTA